MILAEWMGSGWSAALHAMNIMMIWPSGPLMILDLSNQAWLAVTLRGSRRWPGPRRRAGLRAAGEFGPGPLAAGSGGEPPSPSPLALARAAEVRT